MMQNESSLFIQAIHIGLNDRTVRDRDKTAT